MVMKLLEKSENISPLFSLESFSFSRSSCLFDLYELFLKNIKTSVTCNLHVVHILFLTFLIKENTQL